MSLGRTLLSEKNSKYIFTIMTISDVGPNPACNVNFYNGNNIFWTYQVSINLVTLAATVFTANTLNGNILTEVPIGTIIAPTSVSPGLTFDFMINVCDDTLIVSGQVPTGTYDLNTPIFPNSQRWNNVLVRQTNQVTVTTTDIFATFTRSIWGVDPFCPFSPVLNQSGNWNNSKNDTLIASIIIAVVAMVIVLALLIAYCVYAYNYGPRTYYNTSQV
jgi:hypothetical protein